MELVVSITGLVLMVLGVIYTRLWAVVLGLALLGEHLMRWSGYKSYVKGNERVLKEGFKEFFLSFTKRPWAIAMLIVGGFSLLWGLGFFQKDPYDGNLFT